MRKLSALVAVYLLVGVIFAHTQLQAGRAWVCPDESAPHGYTTGSQRRSDACEPAASGTERLGTFLTLTFLWLPLVGGQALVEP